MATHQLTFSRTSGLRLRGVPVLMYHGLIRAAQPVQGGRQDKYRLGEELFREQLRLIGRNGRRVGLLRDLWDRRHRSPSRRPPVAITFDDGRDSDYEVAFPALQDAGVGADFFVNTSTVGKPGHLTWSHIAEMQRTGCSFQSHSHDHIALLWLPNWQLERQLEHSKRILEDRLGAPVDFLAVPYGLVNQRVMSMAQHLGYWAVCNSLPWPARPGRPTVNRIAIHRDTSRAEFLDLLNCRPLPFARRAVRAALSYLPKRLLLRLQPERLGVRVLESGT